MQRLKKLVKEKIRKLSTTYFEEEYVLLPKSQLTYTNDLLRTYHTASFLKDPHFLESYRLIAGIVKLDDCAYINYYRDQGLAHDRFVRFRNLKVLNIPICQGMIVKS